MFAGGSGECHSPDERPVARQVFDIFSCSIKLRTQNYVKSKLYETKSQYLFSTAAVFVPIGQQGNRRPTEMMVSIHILFSATKLEKIVDNIFKGSN